MPIRPIIKEVKGVLRTVPNTWVRFISHKSVWVGVYPPVPPRAVLEAAETALRAAGYIVVREDQHYILTVRKGN